MPKKRQALVDELNNAMRDASGLGVLHSQEMARRAGISSSDLECLDVILLKGPLTAGALAEATGLTTGAVTGLIDRLERAGYARRLPAPADRRKVLVEATRAVGERLMPLGLPMQRAVGRVLEDYSDKEVELVTGFLQRAHQASLAAIAELRQMKTSSMREKFGRKRAKRSR